MIWGMTLEPGKLYTEVIGDEVHLSMASLESRKDFAPEGEKPEGTCHIIMKTEKSEYLLCTLANGVIYQQSLDLKLMPREKVTFSVQGSNMVYLTGYSTSYPDMDDHYEGESDTGEWEPYDTGGNMTMDSADLNESAAFSEEGAEDSQGEISIKTESGGALSDHPPPSADGSQQHEDHEQQQEQILQPPTNMTDQPPIQPKQEPSDDSDQQEMIFSIAELEANVKQEPQQEMQDDITIIPEDDDQPQQPMTHPGDHAQQQQQQQQIHEQQQLQELQSHLQQQQQHSNQLQSGQYIRQQPPTMVPQRTSPARTRAYPQMRQRGRGRLSGSYGRGRTRLPQQTFPQGQPPASSFPPMMAAQGSPRLPVAGYPGAVPQAPMPQDQAMLGQPGSSRQAVPGPSTSSLPGVEFQDTKDLSCFICGKSFLHQSKLKRHLVIHSQLRHLKCKYCGKAYNRKDHLKVHEESHTRVFFCGKCGKKYNLRYTMTKHEKTCPGLQGKEEEMNKEMSEPENTCPVGPRLEQYGPNATKCPKPQFIISGCLPRNKPE